MTHTTDAASRRAPPYARETETERVRLRQFTPADSGDLARILADPEVMKYFGRAPEPLTAAQSVGVLDSMVAHWGRHGFGRWAAEEKSTGRLIGCAGMRSFGTTPELVYLLDRGYWGRGLATEVARECLRFGFSEDGFGFAEVVAFTKPQNMASRNVLEKIGMSFGGDQDFSALLRGAGLFHASPESWEGVTVACYATARARQRLA